MTAAVVTNGKLTVKNVVPEHLFSITAKLKEAGAKVDIYDNAITVTGQGRPKEMHLIETGPYPQLPDGYAGADVHGGLYRKRHQHHCGKRV